MIFKTMGIVCDAGMGTCVSEIELQGHDATVSMVTFEARRAGWSISSTGHFCPEHRQRKAKS